MTRNGKIARLSKAVREELNGRLENGEPGCQVVDWLNGLPEVRGVLAAEFAGQPINEQNLTAWRQGGYQDWVRHQEALAWAGRMAEDSHDFATQAGEMPLAEHLSAPLAVALGRLLDEATEPGGDPAQRRRALLAVAQELALLRRCDHEAARLRMERERWLAEQVEAEGARKAARQLAPLQGMFAATVIGDLYEQKAKETGQVPAEVLAFLSTVTPEQARAAGASPEILRMLGIKPNQSESSRIKPGESACA